MSEVHCLYQWNEKKARQCVSWVSAHDQRYVLFLEDNPAAVILNTFHPRIRCISLPEHDRKEALERLAWEFLYLPFSFDRPDHPILRQLASVHAEISYRAFDFADQGLQLLENFRQNLSCSTGFAKDLYGKFNNIPAIICGGGPSLAASVSELKRLQDGALLIGCGAGVEALLKMGIKPHFAAHVDPQSLHRFSSVDIPIFYQLRTDPKVVAKYKGHHLLVAGTGNFPLESWVQEQWGLATEFDGGWTVGTFGVALAVLLGCYPIILAGMDLAVKNQLYAPGVKTAATTDNFVSMKNREGKAVLSRPDWVLAAEWLEQFAVRHPQKRWGTLSKQGLEIPSIPLISLAEIQGVLSNKILDITLHDGREIWKTIDLSFQRSREICEKIVQEMEKIFPQNPAENGVCALLEHDLTRELVFQKVLDPLWTYWEHVIGRINQSGDFGLYLNRILFFQSICEKMHAL